MDSFIIDYEIMTQIVPISLQCEIYTHAAVNQKLKHFYSFTTCADVSNEPETLYETFLQMICNTVTD